MAVLNGTSSKRVLSKPQFIPMPLIIKSTDSENLICEPEQVKEATRQYRSDLYHHDPPPNIPKPWLTTPSLIAVKNRGNSRPAPGPDEWEKWVVKSMSDEGLELVRRLINYIVANSRFPGDTRDVWLSMFHKRGMRTDLLNWRGNILSNFIANVPMTWLNSRLIPYISEKKVLPDTQVATQKDVQTQDLMSYLSSIKCWSNRNKTQIYAIKRNQMKGFDYLAPEGFYDIIEAIGLPDSIAKLDQ
ncbi:hypothetical protein EV359DRAFT_52417, partial [Lentinula novae-zelandiae]